MSSPCLGQYSERGNSVLDLLVLVLTMDTPLGRLRQAEAKSSWARWFATLCSVEFVFLLGGAQVKARPALFVDNDDRLHMPVSEGYRMIPLKVLLGLAWAIQYRPSQYYMKVDDDSFVCVGSVLAFLHSLSVQHQDMELTRTYAG